MRNKGVARAPDPNAGAAGDLGAERMGDQSKRSGKERAARAVPPNALDGSMH